MRTLLILTAALGGLLAPALAHACSCAPPPAPEVALADAGVVFEGTVTAVPDKNKPSRQGGIAQVEYRFSVTQGWKGNPGQEVRVFTNAHGAACGRTYKMGETYLVYAQMSEEATIHDSICSRTRLAKGASEDYAALGQGTPPRRRGGATPVNPPTDGGSGGTGGDSGASPDVDGGANADPDATNDTSPPADPEPVADSTPAPNAAPEPKADPVEQDDIDKKSCSQGGSAPSLLALLGLLGVAGRIRRRG